MSTFSSSSPGSTGAYRLPEPSPSAADLETVFAFIREFATSRNYGIIQLSFQSGQCVSVRRDQALKPAELSNLVANSRGANHGTRSS